MELVRPGGGTFRGELLAGIEIPPQWNARGIDHGQALRKSAPSAGQAPGPVEAMAEFGRQKLRLPKSTIRR